MLQDAQLILLDEPFNAVDERTVADLMVLIKAWVAEGRTVLAVLHDYELVRQHFPQTLLLARRLVGFGPTREVLRPEMMQQARRFHEAWDGDAPWCEPAAATVNADRRKSPVISPNTAGAFAYPCLISSSSHSSSMSSCSVRLPVP